MKKKAVMTFQDGRFWEGISFGYDQSVSGEAVFNTAMTGYPESLSDPSYYGQLLVLTYPIIGNYGIPIGKIKDEIMEHFESKKPQIRGLVVNNYSESYSHWNAEKSLSSWLQEHKISAVQGVDTREITQYLRTNGTSLAKILIENQDCKWYDPTSENIVGVVSCSERKVYGNGKHQVILIDCGTKYNIIRNLIQRDCTVIQVPWDYDYSHEKYDAIFISNGPGNPEKCEKTILHLQKSLQEDNVIFGICLGCQLLGLSAGGRVQKLKYGHRSHNQPVMNLSTKRCYITSQNHGYAIDSSTIPPDWEISYVNINDQTCEGIRHKSKPFMAVQFHPEAFGGPEDTEFIFDEFIDAIEKQKKRTL